MSTGNAQAALPQIAVGPGPADWAAEAVRHALWDLPNCLITPTPLTPRK
jgi:hypothetical protein